MSQSIYSLITKEFLKWSQAKLDFVETFKL